MIRVFAGLFLGLTFVFLMLTQSLMNSRPGVRGIGPLTTVTSPSPSPSPSTSPSTGAPTNSGGR